MVAHIDKILISNTKTTNSSSFFGVVVLTLYFKIRTKSFECHIFEIHPLFSSSDDKNETYITNGTTNNFLHASCKHFKKKKSFVKSEQKLIEKYLKSEEKA